MRSQTTDGQGMVEYALIIGLIAVVAASGYLIFGEYLASEHDSIFTTLIGLLGG